MGGGNERRNTALPVGDSRLLQLDHRLLRPQYPTVEPVYSSLRDSATPDTPVLTTSDSETLGQPEKESPRLHTAVRKPRFVFSKILKNILRVFGHKAPPAQ